MSFKNSLYLKELSCECSVNEPKYIQEWLTHSKGLMLIFTISCHHHHHHHLLYLEHPPYLLTPTPVTRFYTS